MAQDAGTIYSEIRLNLQRLTGDLINVNAMFDKLNEGLDKSSKKTSDKIKLSLDQMNLAHVALFASIALGVKKALSSYAAYEQAMANVQSVSRATAEDMKKLEEAAGKAGETTRFSSKEAADALYYLASAGFTATQSAEALEGVLALASATQSDLAFTSETVAAAISQFGLEAKDAAKVANVFSAGIAASQATMEKLAVSMRYVGSIANAFNLQIEDVTGILSILYNAGFEASQAGTALRSVLADLSNSASPAIDKLGKLGIAFENVTPASNSFTDIIKALNPIMNDAGSIMSVFGDRAGPVMIKLLSAGVDEIEKYTKAVTGTNQAFEAAKIQNDTLEGSTKRLEHAFGSFGKSVAKEFAPGIKDINNFIADLLFRLKEIPAPIKIFIGLFAGGTLVVSGLAVALSTFAAALGAAIWPIAGVVAGVSALVVISGSLHKAYNQNIYDQIGLTKQNEDLKKTTEALKKSTDDYKKANEELNDKTKTLNETEKQTLENRKAMAAADYLKTLKASMETLEKFGKTQQNLNNVIEDGQSKVNLNKKALDNYAKVYAELKEWEEKYYNAETILQKNSINGTKVYSDLRQKYFSSDYVKKQIERLTQELAKETNALETSKSKSEESRKERTQLIETLAQGLSLGILTNENLKIYNQEIVKEITNRANQLTLAKKQNESGKDEVKTKEKIVQLTDEQIKENEKLQKQITDAQIKIAQMNATELQKIEIERNAAIAEINATGATVEMKNKAIDAVNKLYDATAKRYEIEKNIADTQKRADDQEAILNKLKEERIERYNDLIKEKLELEKQNREINKTTQEYIKQLDDLNKKEQSLILQKDGRIKKTQEEIKAEREKAMAAIEGGEDNAEAMQTAIDAVDAYYDKLAEKAAFDEFLTNMEELTKNILSGFETILSAFSDLSGVFAQKQIDQLQEAQDLQLKAIDDRLNAQLQAEGIAEETTIQKLQKELEEAKKKNDAELIAEKEKELRRAILTEEAEKNKVDTKKKYDREIAMAEYKAAHEKWAFDGLIIASAQIKALMDAWGSAPPPWNIPAITATAIGTGALLIKHIVTEPQMPKLQTGAIITGSQMGTAAIMGENNSNELALNDSSAGSNLLNKFADLVGNRIGTGTQGGNVTIMIDLDGITIAKSTAKILNNGIIRLEQRAIK